MALVSTLAYHYFRMYLGSRLVLSKRSKMIVFGSLLTAFNEGNNFLEAQLLLETGLRLKTKTNHHIQVKPVQSPDTHNIIIHLIIIKIDSTTTLSVPISIV